MRFCVTRQATTPFFAVGHRFAICDEAGETRYRVADRLRAATATAVFRDMAGTQLLTLERRHLLLGMGIFTVRDGVTAGAVQVQRDLSAEGPGLHIRAPDELDLVGDLGRHEYYLMRRGQIIVYVSHRWCGQRRHTYGVDLPDEGDHPLLLACVLALDMLFLYE
jgi:uncharacterized protein YxjI